VIPPPGYSASPENGVVNVSGRPVSVDIDLSITIPVVSTGPGLVGIPWLLLGIALLIAVPALVIGLRSRRKDRVVEGELIRVGHARKPSGTPGIGSGDEPGPPDDPSPAPELPPDPGDGPPGPGAS
jgi:hypothetical protein